MKCHLKLPSAIGSSIPAVISFPIISLCSLNWGPLPGIWDLPNADSHFVITVLPHGVSNHHQLYCLFNCLIKLTIKKASKLHALPAICEGNPPVTGGFPSQMASNAESLSTPWLGCARDCQQPLENGRNFQLAFSMQNVSLPHAFFCCFFNTQKRQNKCLCIHFHKHKTYYCLNKGTIFLGKHNLLFVLLGTKNHNGRTWSQRHWQHDCKYPRIECKMFSLSESSMSYKKIPQHFDK